MRLGAPITLGIRANLGQFAHQLLQVFFVGLTIGLQRNVVPALAGQEFGLAPGSFTLLMAFIVSFGFVKGAMNFVSGALSETLGRRKVLIMGWLVALPIPFVILLAPSWGWIVAANVLLGVNQGFAWSMTVTAKVDITHPSERGLATGFNEFSGYTGVAIAGIATGYLATFFDPRASLFWFGLPVIVLALTMAVLFVRETLPFAHAEADLHASGRFKGPRPAFARGIAETATAAEVFTFITFRHATFAALNQAGLIEKFADALVWAFFPVFLYGKGLSVAEIGWVVGAYGLVWGGSQLLTGPLSDRVGRKWLIAPGLWLCAAGIVATVMVEGLVAWSFTAALAGLGMGMLYPTLIAAVGDISQPQWRGSSLGTYRFWRDLGYGIGALAIGLVADAAGGIEAGFWFTGLALALSGLWVAAFARETLPGKAN